jgi:hypothetical protein
VGRRSNRQLGWIALAAVALVASIGDTATLNKRARLREGPSKETRLLGWLDQGLSVEVDAERNGWYLVRSPDGQSGYVWQDHLSFQPPAVPPGAVTPTTALAPTPSTAPSAAASPTAPPEARPDTSDSGDAALTAEIERLRGEVARLATSQQELVQRVAPGARGGTSAVPIGGDGSAGAAVLFFGVGAVVGWLFGRFAPGRRERRSRLRL